MSKLFVLDEYTIGGVIAACVMFGLYDAGVHWGFLPLVFVGGFFVAQAIHKHRTKS